MQRGGGGSPPPSFGESSPDPLQTPPTPLSFLCVPSGAPPPPSSSPQAIRLLESEDDRLTTCLKTRPVWEAGGLFVPSGEIGRIGEWVSHTIAFFVGLAGSHNPPNTSTCPL